MARNSRPTASASWIVANAAFHAAGFAETAWAVSVTGPATMPGCPVAAIASMSGNPLVNMYGWYCSAASSSQTAPRAIWSARRRPADSRSAAQEKTRGAGSRRSVACADGGNSKVANAASRAGQHDGKSRARGAR